MYNNCCWDLKTEPIPFVSEAFVDRSTSIASPTGSTTGSTTGSPTGSTTGSPTGSPTGFSGFLP